MDSRFLFPSLSNVYDLNDVYNICFNNNVNFHCVMIGFKKIAPLVKIIYA